MSTPTDPAAMPSLSDELTWAAKTMRARAQAAGRGEWTLTTLPAVPDGIAIGHPKRHMITRDGRNLAQVSGRVRAHVQGFSPAVAMELADLLGNMAAKTAKMTHRQDWANCEDADSVMLALGFARTYWASTGALFPETPR